MIFRILSPCMQRQILTIAKAIFGFSNGSEGKSDLGDVGLIPGLGRSPEGEKQNPLQYSCLKNPMDRGACWAAVQRPYLLFHSKETPCQE